MNSDPLNNNKGTRTHPSLETSTSSFSEKERKFVLSNSYWFLFSFFLSFTIDRRKNVHRLFFFFFIDRRLFSDDRSVVVPLPREIHLCFLPLSRVENRRCVAYRDVSPRDTTDRLFSRGNNRSIWTRLSKNFEGWKLIIIMLSIVFFFHALGPQHWKYVKVWINTGIFSLETEFIASRTSGFASVFILDYRMIVKRKRSIAQLKHGGRKNLGQLVARARKKKNKKKKRTLVNELPLLLLPPYYRRWLSFLITQCIYLTR